MTINRPAQSEYHEYFERYVARVSETDLLSVLGNQAAELRRLLAGVSDEQSHLRYAPDKWTLRQVIGHINDTERVMGYRALCIARGEQASLPGFDEGPYAEMAQHDTIALAELLDEFACVRQANLHFLRQLDAAAWHRAGLANGHPATVRGIGYVMAGHVRHHVAVLDEKYL